MLDEEEVVGGWREAQVERVSKIVSTFSCEGCELISLRREIEKEREGKKEREKRGRDVRLVESRGIITTSLVSPPCSESSISSDSST